MVTMNWLRGERPIGSCGLPVPGLAVRIVDPSSREDVPFGEEGELIVRGPNLMKGYHNKPAETAAALRKGWYHTGDLAKSDPSGYLTITGRIKELIIRGGQNIAPAEIEEVVIRHPHVTDCAVVGIRHATLGEVPCLFVVAKRDGAGCELVDGSLQGASVVLQDSRGHSTSFRRSRARVRERSCASSWSRR